MERFDGCQHQPACTVSMWICGQKTELVKALNRGDVTKDQANALLAKWGESPLRGYPVYTGESDAKLETRPRHDAVRSLRLFD